MRIIDDITDFIFLEDKMQKSDIIFIPGGSHPELGEYAAELWKQGFAPLIMPSGGVSIKTGKFNGAKSKKELYNKDYKTDCDFLEDVLIINGVSENSIICEDRSGYTKENWYKTEVGINRVLGELQRCGNQFNDDVLELKEIL